MEIARENFRRLGENYLCALKTAVMTSEELRGRLEWTGLREKLPQDGRSVVAAIRYSWRSKLMRGSTKTYKRSVTRMLTSTTIAST